MVGRRWSIAMPRAFVTRAVVGEPSIDHPITRRDQASSTTALSLKLRVNGTVKQDGNTRDMIYPVDALIEWVSMGMTLLPGSIIATGTPDGVGFARKPPEYLQPGNVMESEVEGIGLLRNRIVAD